MNRRNWKLLTFATVFVTLSYSAIPSPAAENALQPWPSSDRQKQGTAADQFAKPINDPSLWVTPNDYPTHTYDEGTIQSRLTINLTGRVINCHVTESSGSKRLDDATCRNLARRARFSPATNSKGDPIIGFYDGVMHWAIPE